MSTNYVPGTVLDHGYGTVIKTAIHSPFLDVTLYLTELTNYT